MPSNKRRITGVTGHVMIQSVMKIVANEKLGGDLVRLVLADGSGLAPKLQPGQFVNIRVSDTMDPLFRRPFSVFDASRGANGAWVMEILFKVRGRATTILCNLERGRQVDVIGPCGTGFRIARDKSKHVLIGGGIGAAALHLLAKRLREMEFDPSSMEFFLGAETADCLGFLDSFAALKKDIHVATNDGTRGHHGFITELFAKALETDFLSSDISVYACGPEPMLRSLIPICRKQSIPTQVSIERRMACGMGICLSCICKVRKDVWGLSRDMGSSYVQYDTDSGTGYALTCLDGPVFSLEEVILDE
jgi:dihydroorotate dehydrogenase electron transfer subunit